MMKKVFVAAAALLMGGVVSADDVATDAKVLLTQEQCKIELANCKDDVCAKKLDEQGCKQQSQQ